MKRTLQLYPILTLTPFLEEGELVAFNVGPGGTVYLVVALEPLDYQRETPGGIFPKTVPDQLQRYRVVGLWEADTILDIVIEQERFNIHDIQFLKDELLLVCARSHYYGPDKYEKNGRIYSREGKFLREILLGDGIATVQATTGGTIWTSYFDEGVFGNYGWHDPVGASGLVAWDSAGNKKYEFQAGAEPGICDCYALNVVSEEDVWCYYYTGFPLVHLHRCEIKSVWQMPVAGSHAFAISREHALFCGGYKEKETYHLLALGEHGNLSPRAQIELRDPEGSLIAAQRVVGRRDTLHLIWNDSLYRVDVESALRSLESKR